LASGGKWRGIALVKPDIASVELSDMHDAGFRGVRLNYIFGHENLETDVLEISRKIAEFDWHIQLLVDARTLPDLEPLIRRLPVAVVVDHIGRMPTSSGVDHPGFQALLKLLRDRKCWVKLSGANRMGDPTPPYRS